MRCSLISAPAHLVGLALLAAAAPALPQARAPDEHPSLSAEQDWLFEHNVARADVGLGQLTWSDPLAHDAREWASYLARNDLFEHASLQRRKGQGENLWRGTKGHWSPRETIGFFAAERRDFRPGNFPDVSRTGRWSDVGHYTQIIWPETREVGCAVAYTTTDQVLVCRYWPAGNVMGYRLDPTQRLTRR